MKKFKVVLLAAAFTVFALVISVSFAQEEQPRPITLATGMGAEWDDFFQEVVSRWNEQHPDQPVVWSSLPNEDHKQQIRTMLQSNPSPDVLTWSAGPRTNFFADRGLLLDFSETWNTEGFGDSFSPAFAALAEHNDGTYYLPADFFWFAIYYRPSLLEAAGITKAPETWEELLGACDALNAQGVVPIAIGNRFRWPAAGWFDYINMRLNGPDFHKQVMNQEIPFTDERIHAVFNYLQQMFDHECFLPDTDAYDWDEAANFMATGDAAMYLMGDFIREALPDELEEDLDFFQFPVIDPEMPIGEDAPSDGYILSANGANPEGAQEFIAFLGSVEIQQLSLEMNARLGTRTDFDASEANRFVQQGVAMVQSADAVSLFFDRDQPPEMAEIGMNAIQRIWNDPANVDAILEEWEAGRLEYLASTPE